jgi:hypothetical protein
MEVNKKRLSEIFGVSVRTIQNWQDQGMPVARGGGKGNEVLYDSAPRSNGTVPAMRRLRMKNCGKRLRICALLQSQIFSLERLNMNVIA